MLNGTGAAALLHKQPVKDGCYVSGQTEACAMVLWVHSHALPGYESSRSRLDSSRSHWQRCRRSSHSARDRRPRRNSCSTCSSQGRAGEPLSSSLLVPSIIF